MSSENQPENIVVLHGRYTTVVIYKKTPFAQSHANCLLGLIFLRHSLIEFRVLLRMIVYVCAAAAGWHFLTCASVHVRHVRAIVFRFIFVLFAFASELLRARHVCECLFGCLTRACVVCFGGGGCCVWNMWRGSISVMLAATAVVRQVRGFACGLICSILNGIYARVFWWLNLSRRRIVSVGYARAAYA